MNKRPYDLKMFTKQLGACEVYPRFGICLASENFQRGIAQLGNKMVHSSSADLVD